METTVEHSVCTDQVKQSGPLENGSPSHQLHDDTLDIDISEDTSKSHFERCYARIIKNLKSSNALDRVGREFSELRTDEERVKYLLSLDVVDSAVDLTERTSGKCYQSALTRRETGNEMFRKRYYADAHELYTQSIQLFPAQLDNEQSTELAKSYANRATTACHMNEYRACLVDIERAFDLGYPEQLKYKLYEKQGKCFRDLKDYGKAVQALKTGLDALIFNANDLTNEKKSNVLSDMKKQLAACEKLAENSESNPVVVESIEIPKLTKRSNEKFVNATELFDVVYDDVFGRHGVAKEDIAVGDVIVVEKPFASVVLPPFFGTHCYYCFKRFKAPLPCDHCILVRYCTEECKIKAWSEFHELECCVLEFITTTDNCWGHLAHRLIVKLGRQNLVKFRQYLLTDGASMAWNKFGTSPGEVINSGDYKCVHALVTHADERVMADLFFRSVKAVYLLKCLQQGTFFDNQESSDLLSFAGGLLLSNLQLCPCNAHEVSELQVFKSNLEKTQSAEIGAGLYPTLSLLNHSCDPNVVRHFYGDVCVTRAIHNIAKGEQIVDNYGALYPTQTLSERQLHLKKQYFFDCQCTPCQDDWPIYPEMPDGDESPPVLKCENCSESLIPIETVDLSDFPCESCGTKHDVLERMAALDASHERFAEAMSKLLRGEKTAVATLEKHLALIDLLLCLPWKMFNNAQEALKHNYGVDANCFTLP